MEQPQLRTDRSLGDLFGDLSKETTTLVRKELDLARVELTQKATAVGKDIGFLAIGGAVAYAGLLAIVAAIIILLATIGLPWWLAAALVGIVVAVIGYALVQRGLQALQRTNLAPRQTMQTIKEDAEWAKDQTH